MLELRPYQPLIEAMKNATIEIEANATNAGLIYAVNENLHKAFVQSSAWLAMLNEGVFDVEMRMAGFGGKFNGYWAVIKRTGDKPGCCLYFFNDNEIETYKEYSDPYAALEYAIKSGYICIQQGILTLLPNVDESITKLEIARSEC